MSKKSQNSNRAADETVKTRFTVTIWIPSTVVSDEDQLLWSKEEAIEAFNREVVSVVRLYDLKNILLVLEQAPTTGRWHLQGCLTTKNYIREGTLKRQFLPHLSPQIEAQIMKDHRGYCLKGIGASEMDRVLLDYPSRVPPEMLTEGSTSPAPKAPEKIKRSRVEDEDERIATIIRDSGLVKALEEATPGYTLRNLQKMQAYSNVIAPQRSVKGSLPAVLIFFGGTGSGKTATAINLALRVSPSQRPYMVMPQKEVKWFQGYQQQEVMIWDEFRETQIPLDMLLRYLDRYPYDVQVKGSSIPFNSKVIILTMDRDPRSLYTGSGCIDQLIRRCAMIVRFGAPERISLTTSLEPRFRMSQELQCSWIVQDSEGFVAGGTAKTYASPVQQESEEFLDLFQDIFESDIWQEEPAFQIREGVRKTLKLDDSDPVFFYRILKSDDDVVEEFKIKF